MPREQRELAKLRAHDQREIQRLQKELRKKEKTLAEAAALLLGPKKDAGPLVRGRGGLTSQADTRRSLGILDGAVAAGAMAVRVADRIVISLCTLLRWKRQLAVHEAGVGAADGVGVRRKGRTCHVAHRLSH